MNRLLNVLALTTLAAVATACNSASSPVSPGAGNAPATEAAARPGFADAAKPGSLTIVGIVTQDDGKFDVLQAAVIRAGLVDTLNGSAQYTVFAPTDAAFVSTLGAGSEGAAIAAVTAMDVDALRDILLFHVTNGRRNSNAVLAAPAYTMLNGDRLTRERLSAAGLATTDVSASNGIIHVINAVLMPPAE